MGDIDIWGGYDTWPCSVVVAESDCEVVEMSVSEFLELPLAVAVRLFESALVKCR